MQKLANCQYWEPVGGGVNRHVRAFYADTISNGLYLAGTFKFANGEEVNGIAMWNGEEFEALGTGSDNCVNFSCPGFLSVMQYKDELYCSHLGFSIGGVQSHSIARWDGIQWDSVGGGVKNENGGGAIIWEQMVHDDELYIMGRFTYGGNVFSPAIIKWDGQAYLPMDFPYIEPLTNISPQILGAVIFQNELYVGGQFASGTNIQDHVDVAKFDGQNWQPVGGGIKGAVGDINDLFVYKDELYICGNFRKSGGNAGNGIMKLNGETWVDVGGSFDEETVVAHQMIEYHGDMYVFGTFNYVGGGVKASNVAKWNGEKWCGLPNEFDRRIERAIVLKDTIFIGGWFNFIDGDSIPYLAKWFGDYVDTCQTVTGTILGQKAVDYLTFSPNPFLDNFNLYLPESFTVATLTMYSSTAQPIHAQSIQAGWNMVRLASLPPGLYFYEVRDACLPGQEGKLLQSGKLVKVE